MCSSAQPEEPLRVPLGTRDARRGALLHADRVGEAGRRRTGRVPRRGDAPGDRQSRHRHAAPRPRRRI